VSVTGRQTIPSTEPQPEPEAEPDIAPSVEALNSPWIGATSVSSTGHQRAIPWAIPGQTTPGSELWSGTGKTQHIDGVTRRLAARRRELRLRDPNHDLLRSLPMRLSHTMTTPCTTGTDGPSPARPGTNGTWVTPYCQDMGYSFSRRAAGQGQEIGDCP